MLQLVLFTFSLLVFSLNLYFLGLLYFSDKQDTRARLLTAMGVATCYWLVLDAVAGVVQLYAHEYIYALRSVMLVVAPICFLGYMIHLSAPRLSKSKIVRWILIILPGIDIILVLSNPLTKLVFSQDASPLPVYGPLFGYHAAIAYLAIALGFFLLIRYIVVKKPPILYALSWVIICVICIAVNVLYTIEVIAMTQDIAPFGFAVIFILFALYWYRSRLDSLKTAALSDAFESYSDAASLVGINGVIEESNEAFAAYFPDFDLIAGQTPAVNLLQYFNGIAADERSQQVTTMLINQQAPAKSEITLKLISGEIKTFAVVWQDVLNNRGRLAGWLLILNDVSEYHQMINEINEQNKALEQLRVKAEAASEAKTTFLASMSHEMRTPLNAIIGLSELTLDNDLDPKSRNNILKVNESGTGLLKVINDILDISKIESGRFELVPVVYKTAELISDIVNINKVRIGDKPIQLLLNVSSELPFELLGDELRVRQIFSNLLSNAIKYTNEGTVMFTVTFEEDAASVNAPVGGNLCITIKDTGIGIKDEDLQSLFSEYHQVDIKKNRSVEGTGLGLSIVNNLVGLMGGSIDVISEYGKGSQFTAIIPQKIACNTAIGKEVARDLELMRYADSKVDRDSIEHARFSDKRVLVVDDVDVNLEVAKGMLEPYGLQIDTALSGQESVDLVRAGKPRYDLIFMDHMMPLMDGVQAVRLMRTSIDTDYARSVPIIALTANAMVGSREMFFNEGFQDFLAKPINSVELDNLIHRWLGN